MLYSDLCDSYKEKKNSFNMLNRPGKVTPSGQLPRFMVQCMLQQLLRWQYQFQGHFIFKSKITTTIMVLCNQ